MTDESKKFVKSKIANLVISALTTFVGILTYILTGGQNPLN